MKAARLPLDPPRPGRWSADGAEYFPTRREAEAQRDPADRRKVSRRALAQLRSLRVRPAPAWCGRNVYAPPPSKPITRLLLDTLQRDAERQVFVNGRCDDRPAVSALAFLDILDLARRGLRR